MGRSFFCFLFLAPALSYAAAVSTPAAVPPAPQTRTPQVRQPQVQPPGVYDPKDGPGFCIFGGWSGKPFDTEAAFRSIVWKTDVIYVGETPGRIQDHLAQLEVLKTLRVARGSKIAVGFEMLNMTLQPVLDDYAAGKLTEEEFLAKADWKTEWGFDFNLYKPVFDFMVRNKLRGLALNVPKKVVAKIARMGLEGLDDEDKKFLPETVNIIRHKKYLEYLKASFSGHGGTPVSAWDNYLASMSAWNEGMGSRVAEFVNANPGWSVLVLAGNGHVIYNAAIPASVKSRTGKIRQASFYTESADKCPAAFPKENKDMASYLWYIRHSAPAKADAK